VLHAADRAGVRPWAARIGVSALFLANGAGFGAWAASVPFVKESLGASAGALGAALLAVAAGAIAAMPVAGWLGARGVPRLLSGTGVFFALALPWPGLAPSVKLLAATLLVMGAAAGSMDVCMNARASRVQEGWGRPIMSSFHAAFAVGGLVGTLLVAASESLGVGPESGLLMTSGVLAVAVIGHAGLDRDPDLAGPGATGRILWPGRALAALGALCLLAFMTEGAVADWSGVFLAQVAHYQGPAAASGFAAFSAAMVIGRLSGDWVVRRFGPAPVLSAGGIIAAFGIALALAVPAAGPAGFALVGLGGANMAPVLFSAAGRASAAASAGVAAVATLGYAGMVIGPPLIGVIADRAGLRAALAVLAAAMATIALASRQVSR